MNGAVPAKRQQRAAARDALVTAAPPAPLTDSRSSKLGLDDLDYEILRLLSINARVSNRSLGRRLHLPESVVRGRIRRMWENGIIHFSAVMNSARADTLVLAQLWIDATEMTAIASVAEALAARPQFHMVMTLLGRADILAVTALGSCLTLVDDLQSAVTGIDGITDIRYSFSQTIIKQAPITCGVVQTTLDYATRNC